MARLAYSLLVGLVGAGLVHVVVLMLLPGVSEKDAWSQLSAAADFNAFTPFATSADDPLFQRIACRFDLGDGPTHVVADGSAPFWSASVYDRNGNNLYSLSDRDSADDALDFVVVTPAQMLALRKDLPAEDADSTFIVVEADEGIVALRAFVPDQSWKPAVDAFLSSAACTVQS